MRRDRSERRTVVEFATDNLEKGLAAAVVLGVVATKYLKNKDRDIKLGKYTPEARSRDSYDLFGLAMGLMNPETSTKVAAATYDRVPPLIPVRGHLTVDRPGPDIDAASIIFTPTVLPDLPEGFELPKVPRKVYQTVTTLRFRIPEDWAREHGTRYYETTQESETSIYPTEHASSWFDLAAMIDDGVIEGELAVPPRVGPVVISHEEALAYQTCLRSAIPI